MDTCRLVEMKTPGLAGLEACRPAAGVLGPSASVLGIDNGKIAFEVGDDIQ